jgi:hypothetical protein
LACFYEKDTGDEDGGFEFDVVLPKKPQSNVIRWTLQHKNLDFFYQPELTQEEIDQGSERLENVVGSYAVYHKTGRNNKVGGKEYRTGKAFHIYRPYAEDATGKKVWCDLHIDSDANEMTVTIPEKALERAVYPVVVDPTFGYTTAGATFDSITSDDVYAFTANAPENGTVQKHTFSIQHPFGSSSQNIKAVLYNSDTDSLVGTGDGGSYTASNSQVWRDTPTYSTEPSITSGTNYWVGVILDTAGSLRWLYYDSGVSGDGAEDTSNSYASPDSSLGTLATDDKQYSIYATYTASGGGGSTRRVFNIS